MKKFTIIASYIVIVFVLIIFFYEPIHSLIWSTIAKVFPWHELSNSIMATPLGGKFKLMTSTIVFMFFMLISPAGALVTVQDKLNKKTIPILFIFLSFYTVTIAFIEALAYYYYFIYKIVPSHDASFTMFQIPLKELGIFTCLIVVGSTYLFFQKTVLNKTTEQPKDDLSDPVTTEIDQKTSSKPTSLVWSILSLQIIMWINIAIFIVLTAFYLYGLTIDPELMMMSITFSGKILGAVFGLFFAVLLFFTSRGLMNQKKWARIVTILIGMIMLFGFPIGTIIGTILIYGMTIGWPEETIQIKS